jgi:hypothetical protein
VYSTGLRQDGSEGECLVDAHPSFYLLEALPAGRCSFPRKDVGSRYLRLLQAEGFPGTRPVVSFAKPCKPSRGLRLLVPSDGSSSVGRSAVHDYGNSS